MSCRLEILSNLPIPRSFDALPDTPAMLVQTLGAGAQILLDSAHLNFEKCEVWFAGWCRTAYPESMV